MIDLPAPYKEEVRRLVRAHAPACEIRVFGSRVNGNALPYSDLDIALVASRKIPDEQIEALKDALADSDLPFQVDVLDWHAIADSFRQKIAKHYEIL